MNDFLDTSDFLNSLSEEELENYFDAIAESCEIEEKMKNTAKK